MSVVVCADVGSTFTKVAVVDSADGMLRATAAHPTTAATDVWDGLVAAVWRAGARAGVDVAAVPWLVCSSAGGGLRLAVVGYEELVTARAGARVGLSAGARVVRVSAGWLDDVEVARLRAARPEVLLLVGGTDGGDVEVLLHNAGWLAGSGLAVPVVVAGNADGGARAAEVLAEAGVPVAVAGNVLPRIGVLAPGSARAAVREVFLRRVIGGKGLSRDGRFAASVRAATPDAVLAGVEVLAGVTGADLLVVDVGGATTDVYSVVEAVPLPGAAEPRPVGEVAGWWGRARTVEGDLGVWSGASGVVAAAVAERLVTGREADGLAAAVAARAAGQGRVAAGDGPPSAVDLRLARLAALVAVRRHARVEERVPDSGRDLRRVRWLVGSGGVLRAAASVDAVGVLESVAADRGGGWLVPRAAVPVVDGEYVLAAAGLLAADHPRAARGLVERYLLPG
ncbi:glutamate mutase L [Solwaraspora sp. WMMD406]|uniref:glutamate mutase L n=1 Tax=Solwaraspora sp. WMMD406 TaxID=3016095 RepID=UPI00241659D4|nr:glutamate mutase L [Solwaraspora sp. WMMD406]MDG4766200.1 glutamate mutase L [Solwaraspora sp. WMMD406]MDG4768671.1 glutamate mutase L [Solwaraspora sp. WMMD406]